MMGTSEPQYENSGLHGQDPEGVYADITDPDESYQNFKYKPYENVDAQRSNPTFVNSEVGDYTGLTREAKLEGDKVAEYSGLVHLA